MNCSFCGKPVDPDSASTYKQVLVWVGGPKKNSAKLSEDTGKVAHSICIHDALRGHAPDQPALDF